MCQSGNTCSSLINKMDSDSLIRKVESWVLIGHCCLWMVQSDYFICEHKLYLLLSVLNAALSDLPLHSQWIWDNQPLSTGHNFLIHFAGALLVLMSMAGWVLWYSGNIDGLTSKKELGHISSAVDRLARNLSRKIRTYRGQHWDIEENPMPLFVSINELIHAPYVIIWAV